jgi:hypothetical protein
VRRIRRKDLRAPLYAAAVLSVFVLALAVGVGIQWRAERRALRALAAHEDWEALVVDRDRGVFGKALGAGADELARRRVILEGVAADLGSASQRGAAALSRVRAYERLVAFQAGADVDVPADADERTADDLVVDGLVFQAQGKPGEARSRVDRALAKDSRHVAARLLKSTLLAEADPRGFLEFASQLEADAPERSACARLAPKILAQLYGDAVRASATKEGASAPDFLGLLARKAAALGIDPTDLEAAKIKALRDGSDDWVQRLTSTSGRARLKKVLAAAPAVPASCAGDSLDEVAKGLVEKHLPRLKRIVDFEAYLFYELGYSHKIDPKLWMELDKQVTRNKANVNVVLAALRFGASSPSGNWNDSPSDSYRTSLRTVAFNLDPEQLEGALERFPESRALRVSLALAAEKDVKTDPARRRRVLAELESAFTTGDDDLAPGYTAEAHVFAAELLKRNMDDLKGAPIPAKLSGDLRRHAELALQGLEREPDKRRAVYDLLALSHTSVNDYAAAFAVIDESIDYFDGGPNRRRHPAELATMLRDKAKLMLELGRMDEAETNLRKALEVRAERKVKQDARTVAYLITLLRRTDQLDEAVALAIETHARFKPGSTEFAKAVAATLRAANHPRTEEILDTFGDDLRRERRE